MEKIDKRKLCANFRTEEDEMGKCDVRNTSRVLVVVQKPRGLVPWQDRGLKDAGNEETDQKRECDWGSNS